MRRSRGNRFADIFYALRRVFLTVLVCAAVLGVLLAGAGYLAMRAGKASLYSAADGKGPSLDLDGFSPAELTSADMQSADDARAVWKEGWVRYGDSIYEYNEDILTFLFLGIDKEGKVSANETATDGGQSDAIFLIVADPDTKKISLVAINRDTIVDVFMPGVGENGEDIVYASQIAVQHGFGDGLQGSCELTRDRVSELFYDLPIHAYASFNMGGIAALNDALGGVEVTVLEDMTRKNRAWSEGTRITLKGMDAFWYVKWRDTTIYESARGRLERQKQYLNAFLKKAIAATKEDITIPLTLYNSFKDYIVTDITVDEIMYLAGELSGYSFDGDIYTLEGTTGMQGEHEAFYPDETALKELIIKVFYRKVGQ